MSNFNNSNPFNNQSFENSVPFDGIDPMLIKQYKELRPYQFNTSSDPDNLIKQSEKIYDLYNKSTKKTPETLYTQEDLTKDQPREPLTKNLQEEDRKVASLAPMNGNFFFPPPAVTSVNIPLHAEHKEELNTLPTETEGISSINKNDVPLSQNRIEEIEARILSKIKQEFIERDSAVFPEEIPNIQKNQRVMLQEQEIEGESPKMDQTATPDKNFYDHLINLEETPPFIKKNKRWSFPQFSFKKKMRSKKHKQFTDNPAFYLTNQPVFTLYSFYWQLMKFSLLFFSLSSLILYILSPMFFYSQSLLRVFLVSIITTVILIKQEEKWAYAKVQNSAIKVEPFKFRWFIFFLKGTFINIVLSFIFITNHSNVNSISEYSNGSTLNFLSLINVWLAQKIQNFMTLSDFSQFQQIILYLLLVLISILYVTRCLQRKSSKE